MNHLKLIWDKPYGNPVRVGLRQVRFGFTCAYTEVLTPRVLSESDMMASWQDERWKIATYPLKLEYEPSGHGFYLLVSTRDGRSPRKDGSNVRFRNKRDAQRALNAWQSAWTGSEYEESSINGYFRNGE